MRLELPIARDGAAIGGKELCQKNGVKNMGIRMRKLEQLSMEWAGLKSIILNQDSYFSDPMFLTSLPAGRCERGGIGFEQQTE
jgi:hypothetical protein